MANSTNCSDVTNADDFTDYLTPDPEAVRFRTIVNQIDMYLVPCIVCVGLVGNGLSLSVFLHTHLRRMSWSIYLAALAVSDSGFLACTLVSWANNVNIHLYHTQGFCQLFVYLTYVWSFLSVWYIVAFTVERYLVISLPLRRNEMTNPRRAKIVVTSMAVFAMLLYNVGIWTSGLIPVYGYTEYCAILPEYYTLMTVFTNIDTFLTLIIPFLLIVFLNIGIIYKLVRHHARRQELMIHVDPPPSPTPTLATRATFHVTMDSTVKHQKVVRTVSTRSLVRLTYMLVVVSMVFLVLNLPFHAIRMYVFVISLNSDNYVPSHRIHSWQKIFQYVYYSNFAVNFFLYSACGRHFRLALKHLIQRSNVNWRRKYNKMCGRSSTPASQTPSDINLPYIASPFIRKNSAEAKES